MESMIVGGYIWHPRKSPTKLHYAKAPKKADIAMLLEGIRDQKGEVVASQEPWPEFGPHEMSIFAQEGRYVLVVNATWEDETLSSCLSLVNRERCGFRKALHVIGSVSPIRYCV